MRNPRLKKLKDRMTPAELERRRANMASKGTWREETVTNQAKTMGLINGLAVWLKDKDEKQTRTNYALYGMQLVLVVAVIGLVMGWW